jgi:hypothetical protein
MKLASCVRVPVVSRVPGWPLPFLPSAAYWRSLRIACQLQQVFSGRTTCVDRPLIIHPSRRRRPSPAAS